VLRKLTGIAAIGVAAVSIATLATIAWIAGAPDRPRRPDIIVLVIDTLRADRLAHHGNTANLTPFLDSLADRSNFVPYAYAQAPWTSPSVASLFTSRYQSQHGIVILNSVLSASEITIAETLQSAGYATACYSANGLLSKYFGYDQGFDVHKAQLNMEKNAPTRRASELVERAMAWLDRVAGTHGERPPVFLYFQFMETHAPYAPPKEFLDRIRGDKPPLDVGILNEAAVGTVPPSDEMARDIEDVYDATVIEIDVELRKLFAKLDERGMLEDSLVVVTADHGDEFHDHGGMSHNHTLYNELLHVPLLVRTPGQSSGNVVSRVVGLVDVAPTILELAGIARPPTFEGRSFAADLEPQDVRSWAGRFLDRLFDDGPEPFAYSERVNALSQEEPPTSHARSLIGATSKVIESMGGTRTFYDLAADPREQRPNALPERDREKLVAALERMHEHVSRTAPHGERHELDEQQKEALRALGYAQ
jgi:arylsulfatase A-like enzyme